MIYAFGAFGREGDTLRELEISRWRKLAAERKTTRTEKQQSSGGVSESEGGEKT